MMNWVCTRDKTPMFISEEGRLRCNAYYADRHNDLIMNWRFDCGDRSGPHQSTHFVAPDYEGFTHAMSIAMCTSSKTTAEWVTQLILNLKKQYGRK